VEDPPEVEEAWESIQPDRVFRDRLERVTQLVISQAHVVMEESDIRAVATHDKFAAKIYNETLYITGVNEGGTGWTEKNHPPREVTRRCSGLHSRAIEVLDAK